jgi:hypothetical protein
LKSWVGLILATSEAVVVVESRLRSSSCSKNGFTFVSRGRPPADRLPHVRPDTQLRQQEIAIGQLLYRTGDAVRTGKAHGPRPGAAPVT